MRFSFPIGNACLQLFLFKLIVLVVNMVIAVGVSTLHGIITNLPVDPNTCVP